MNDRKVQIQSALNNFSTGSLAENALVRPVAGFFTYFT